MTPLETALVVLVIIWTIIFALLAVAMVVLLLGLKKALDKINNILSQGEDMARGLGVVGKATAGGLAGILLKTAGDRLKSSGKKK
jgi:uncharacterized protein YoxC